MIAHAIRNVAARGFGFPFRVMPATTTLLDGIRRGFTTPTRSFSFRGSLDPLTVTVDVASVMPPPGGIGSLTMARGFFAVAAPASAADTAKTNAPSVTRRASRQSQQGASRAIARL